MSETSIYEIANMLNHMKVGQAIDIDPMVMHLSHDWFTYGYGAEGFKRHLLQNLVGSAYGTFSVHEKYSDHGPIWCFRKHEGGDRLADRDARPLPGKEGAWTALGWPRS